MYMKSTMWMHPYYWSSKKNETLQTERNIRFEQIVDLLSSGGLLDEIAHHNQDKYAHQRMFIVNKDGYVCYVPFVIQKDWTFFLKTIIPTRKLTKYYKHHLSS